MKVYKTVTSARDYPSTPPRIYKLECGDSFTICSDEPVRIGESYKSDDSFRVTKIFYSPKKWWQFWKKKAQLGFVVTCAKETKCDTTETILDKEMQ